LALFSCSEETEKLVPTDEPIGTLTTLATGTFTKSAVETKGAITKVKDSEGTEWLEFGSDFVTEVATGTVAVYFVNENALVNFVDIRNPAQPGNVLSSGFIIKNGKQYLKVVKRPSGSNLPEASSYTHVLLFCEAAEVVFGYAKLNK
jgi:hypothetical protein